MKRMIGGYSVAAIMTLMVAVMGVLTILEWTLDLGLYMVVSGSMSPMMERGDAVMTLPVEKGKVSKGDVIMFNIDGKEFPIIHRVTSVAEFEGTRYFRTKGDMNSRTDARSTTEEDILGVEVIVLPKIGYAVYALSPLNSWAHKVGFVLVAIATIYFSMRFAGGAKNEVVYGRR